MIILYILGIIGAISLIGPGTLIPVYIKWPVALALVILITGIFNACKKDTIFTTRPTGSALVKRGLYHPLVTYTAFTLYLTGFLGIYAVCKENGVANIANGFGSIIGDNVTVYSLVIIGIAVLVNNLFKWVLSKHADTTTIRERSLLYVILVITLSVALVYNMVRIDVVHLNEFISAEHNYFIFYGIPAIMLIVDLVVTIVTGVILHRKNKGIMSKREKAKLAKKAAKEAKIAAKEARMAAKEQAIRDAEEAEYQAMLAKKQAKIDRKEAKKQAKIDCKKAKKQAKIDRKLARMAAKDEKKALKEAEKDAKKRIKIARIRANNPKKADKLVNKYDKKIAKKTRKEVRKAQNETIDQVVKDGQNRKQYAKEDRRIDKKMAKLEADIRAFIVENSNE